METHNCQNCKNDFTIEPDDFSFYEKIKVPPPTFCPECRMIRRLIWRNNRSLYKRTCGLCQKSLISMYKNDGAPVYCIECFNSDDWDIFLYAMDIVWDKPFLSQFYELLKKQPRIYQLRIGNVINSDYANSVVNSKNAYLSYSVINCEDIMYCEGVDESRNSFDSLSSFNIDQCYQNILSSKNYNSHFLISSHSCIDSYFLYDCANCQNCCLSSNLRNQQYVFKNKKLSKEEYEKAIGELKLETYSGLQNAQEEFDVIYKSAIHRYAYILASQNVIGDFITNSKNILNSFDVTDNSEDVRYSFRIIKTKDVMDCNYILTGEREYECSSGSSNSYNQIASFGCLASKNIEYSFLCKNCSDCFGCVGLKNAKYCILNKQYTKEEYESEINKLKKYMIENPYIDKAGRVFSYGDFFPFEFSPFTYNETATIDYFPINKEQASRNNYPWKEKENRAYEFTKKSTDLADSIQDVQDSVTEDIIECLNKGKEEYQCTTAYKITPNELQFYRQKGLPLPRYCPNCRHYERLKYRNPMRLYKRGCSNRCGREFETTYAPERPEKVYCEICYQSEVL